MWRKVIVQISRDSEVMEFFVDCDEEFWGLECRYGSAWRFEVISLFWASNLKTQTSLSGELFFVIFCFKNPINTNNIKCIKNINHISGQPLNTLFIA